MSETFLNPNQKCNLVSSVKNWKERVLKRKAWNDLVEKAKIHKGFES
jgi:hypothetical protein